MKIIVLTGLLLLNLMAYAHQSINCKIGVASFPGGQYDKIVFDGELNGSDTILLKKNKIVKLDGSIYPLSEGRIKELKEFDKAISIGVETQNHGQELSFYTANWNHNAFINEQYPYRNGDLIVVKKEGGLRYSSDSRNFSISCK